MKRFLLLSLLALAFSCIQQPADPHREALEQYVLEHIQYPETYKFDSMGPDKEYRYMNDLFNHQYKLKDDVRHAEGEEKAALQAEIDKIDELYGTMNEDIVLYEYSLYFTYKDDPSAKERQKGIVVAQYYPDGKLKVITLDPGTLPEYPALQMLKEQGRY